MSKRRSIFAPQPKPPEPVRDAQTPVTTYNDGKFILTALVMKGEGTGSIAILDANGRRLAEVNISYLPECTDPNEEVLIVDVIDVEKRWTRKAGLVFNNHQRQRLELDAPSNLVSADFRRDR